MHLGIYLVAYGAGHESLQISIASDVNRSTPVREQETPVLFTSAPQDEAPGVAALQLAMRDCQIGSAGLHWLSATIGSGSAARIPLYIQERGTWQGHVDLDAILRHRAAQRDNQPA